MTGKIVNQPERNRSTPFHPAHSTAVAGLQKIAGGDHRFYNNIFVGDGTAGLETEVAVPFHSPRGAGFGLCAYDVRDVPIFASGNVYFNGAMPWTNEVNATVNPALNPKVKLLQKGDQFYLELMLAVSLRGVSTHMVTTELLGKAKVPELSYENPDGSPLKINADYFGRPRSATNPTAGPFENPKSNPIRLKLQIPAGRPRWMPNSRAIRQWDQPFAAKVVMECCKLALS